MADGKLEYIISANDQASGVFNTWKQNAIAGSKEIGASVDRASASFRRHGDAVNSVSGWIRQQRAEQRQQNFLFREAQQSIAAAGLALTLFSETGGKSNKTIKDISNSVNAGIVAFQGLGAISSLLPGPWGLLVQSVGALTAGILTFTSSTDEASAVVQSHTLDIEALTKAYDEWQGKLKGTTDTFGVLNKDQISLTQKNAELLQKQINNYRSYLDELTNGEKIQVKLFGQTQETRRTGIEAIAAVNRKYLQESIVYQQAYNKAIEEQMKTGRGRNAARAHAQALQAVNDELTNLLLKQEAYTASLASTTSTGVQATGTIGAMKAELEQLNKELERTPAGTKAFDNINARIRSLTTQIDEAKKPAADFFSFSFIGPKMRESFRQGEEDVRAFKANIKAIFGEGGTDETIRVRIAIEADLAKMENSLLTETQIIDQWEQSVLNSWDATEEQKTRATQIAAQRRKAIELRAAQDTFRQYAQLANQAIALISEFSNTNAQARIDDINAEREAALAAIDEKLAAEGLSEDTKKRLLSERAALEKQYDDEARAAKREAFEADKQARFIMSIIDTASAFVEALPNLPLAFAVAALGAAKTAFIASQPTPRFHEGTPGTVFFDAPRSQEFPIIVRGGERFQVKTEEQHAASSINLTVHFHDAVSSKRMVKNAIREVLRETSLPITEAFTDNRAILVR